MFDSLLQKLDAMSSDEKNTACLLAIEMCADQLESMEKDIRLSIDIFVESISGLLCVDNDRIIDLPGAVNVIDAMSGKLECDAIDISLDQFLAFLYRNRSRLPAGVSKTYFRTKIEAPFVIFHARVSELAHKRAEIYRITNDLVYRLYDLSREEVQAVRSDIKARSQ